MMYVFSGCCLGVIAVLCLMGIFSQRYSDNWMQFVGLWGLLAWSAARLWQVIDGAAHLSGQQLVLHVALALFACGTAYKVFIYGQPHPKNGKAPEAQGDLLR
jgi:uncharacterized membrane protein